MPKFSTYVDVDVDEFISACSKGEIKKLIDSLIEDGHINVRDVFTSPSKNPTIMEIEHLEICNKLASNYYRMSTEDCDLLEQIASKY
jgi:hypothetical protein